MLDNLFSWINDLKLDDEWYKSVISINYEVYRKWIESSEVYYSEWHKPNRVRPTTNLKWDGVQWQ